MDLSRRELVGRAAAAAALYATGGLAEAAPARRLTAQQLQALRAAVRGVVYAPGGSGYDGARVLFNRRFDAIRPPAVVRVRDSADVVAVVRWAERFDVSLVARSGGHAYNGASTSATAVVVDVGALHKVAPRGADVTVGPGARLIDVDTALAARGRAIPAGSCPTVALGGLALGGGVGLAGRALGLTLDRVTSIDVVTADGRRRTVDATHDDDLFWALRGGGGSFGIVTALRLRTHAVRRAAWFTASFPGASRAEALAAWDSLAPTAPRALTAIFTLSGAGGATALGQHLGSEQVLRGLIGSLARVPGARVQVGTSPFLALQRRWAGCASGGCHTIRRDRFDASSIYVSRRLGAAGRRAFLAAADSGATLVCDALGGAINAVDADATAFVHRDARFSVQILDYSTPSSVQRARALLAPYGGGAYANYSDLRLHGALRAYYGANYERLVAVKRAHDPGNRFAQTQGIRA